MHTLKKIFAKLFSVPPHTHRFTFNSLLISKEQSTCMYCSKTIAEVSSQEEFTITD